MIERKKETAESIIELINKGWTTDDEAIELYEYIRSADMDSIEREKIQDTFEINMIYGEYSDIMYKRAHI